LLVFSKLIYKSATVVCLYYKEVSPASASASASQKIPWLHLCMSTASIDVWVSETLNG